MAQLVSSPAPRRGRRPGAPDTRAAILDAARELFAAQGFAGTSVRAVAAGAGVDAALVHHYFGTKDDLFVAALELPVDPRERLAGGDRPGAGRRRGADAAGLPLGLGRPGAAAAAARRWPAGSSTRPASGCCATASCRRCCIRSASALGIDRPDVRMPLVASQMIGLILTRYVLEVEPLASMPADDLVAIYAPTIQRYLTGPLP